MKRITSIVLTVALVTALAAVPLGAASAITTESAQDNNDGNESIQPGERLAGVVGVQEAEIDGEVSERTYGIKIANARTNETKADVVGEQLEEAEDRLEELEDRLENVNESRESGEITEGQYRSKVATIAAEKRTVERLAEGAEVTAGELPEDVLEERGINVSAIQELRERAGELGGQEISEIARSIAGDDVGQSPADDRRPGAPIDTQDENRSDGNGADRTGESDERETDTDTESSGSEDDRTEESNERETNTDTEASGSETEQSADGNEMSAE